MECTVEQHDLSKALGKLQALVSKKSTMPILSYYLIRVSENNFHVSGTDLEVSVTLSVPGTVHQMGSIAIPGKMFVEVVRQLSDGPVILKSTEDARLEIKSGKSRFRLNSVDANEYPGIPGLSLSVAKYIKASLFLDMLNKTLYAVSTDSSRYNLGGVCIETSYEGALRVVATDGHRLAMVTRDAPGLGEIERKIVPRRGLSEFRRILEELGERDIGFDFDEGFLIFETLDSKVALRLMDVEFPDFNQVLPAQSGVLGTVNTQEFSDALRRMSLMVTAQGKCVRLDLSGSGLRISSSSPELGDGEEIISLEYQGDPISVGFNARFLADIAGCFQSGEGLILEVSGDLEPARFYSLGDESALAVVMPARID
jgi:DNA polymerase-3 subunit beta